VCVEEVQLARTCILKSVISEIETSRNFEKLTILVISCSTFHVNKCMNKKGGVFFKNALMNAQLSF